MIMNLYNCYSIMLSTIRYSRKILWLKVAPSNHDPRFILKYYLECIEELEGVLMLIARDIACACMCYTIILLHNIINLLKVTI